MIGWIIYLTGVVVVARKVITLLRDDGLYEPDDWTEDAAFRAIGLLIAIPWPLILLGAVLTGRLPKSHHELRAELAAHERRIAQLERERDHCPRPMA
ncbi:hypothetical protein [Planomonospora sp. ID82291]|uniref:hypothetical protein n=1 Tax=Planomonospora sp. ID82291 TaxID=2738136 RepID=UPI0018C39ABB|nr:hypothetical protein [Planomonospora sp. ID82291]MBG0818924.1 hypothetical protein [Planomonospora sp. ID82291]